ncbi:MAG: hypothetical protein GY716_02980 [bacterium]|nr:hypothetical protein [bacterium]
MSEDMERLRGEAPSEADRVEVVRRLVELALPVADPGSMKRESVPDPKDLMP